MRKFILAVAVCTLSLGLSACGEEEKAEQKAPEKKVEQVEKKEPKPDDNNLDMTPAEAMDNMKRDAGIVADKATDAFNAVKDAATKALSE